MKKHNLKLLFSILFFGIINISYSQNYKNASEVNSTLTNFAQKNAGNSAIHNLGETYSKIPILLLEVGTETKKKDKSKPALFILGNPDGTIPLATEAALKLAQQIIESKQYEQFTWYILPCLNPEALNHYFDKVKYENPLNSKPYNNDMDDATDEDGPDDLNADGYITQMRVLDPMGNYIINEEDSRLMRMADATKGEKGLYKIYEEGIDNDGDGLYNEDSKGGVNNAVNFPHLFEVQKNNTGKWPGSETEVYALMEFMFQHTEIAATFTFGATDFCIQEPNSGRKGSADFDNIKLPKRTAEQFGLDENTTYKMQEILELYQSSYSANITAEDVASYLGLGAIVNPLKEDLSIYSALNEEYKTFLKEKKVNLERLDPERAKNGSFELWSYYQLGVPTFSMNFFTLEKAKADTSKTEKKDKLSKKEEKPKIDEKTKALLVYSKNEFGDKAFVNWTEYNHPEFGKVEIGGFIPFLESTPKYEYADSLINLRLPWVFEVAKKLAKLSIADFKAKDLGTGIYQVEIWVSNLSFIPFPSYMGNKNKQVAPAVLLFENTDIEFISGKNRTPINQIEGNKTIKQTFIVKAKKGSVLNVKLISPNAGNGSKQIKL